MNLYQLKTAVTQRDHKVKDTGTNIIPCNTTLYKIIQNQDQSSRTPCIMSSVSVYNFLIFIYFSWESFLYNPPYHAITFDLYIIKSLPCLKREDT